MRNIVINIPTSADIPLMRKWGTQARELAAYEGGSWHSQEALKDYIENPKDDFLRIAKVDDQMAGMILVNVLRNWAYVDFLFVHPPFRLIGVGQKLISTAITHVQSKGIDTLNLVTHPGSENVKFYKNIGFEFGDTLIWARKII